jgi:putative ABC transport system substrate-binding protein
VLDRRAFLSALTGSLLAAPRVAQAQPAMKTYRVGVPVENLFPETTAAFEQALFDLGYTPGSNLSLEYKSADGRADQLPTLAAALAQRNVDVAVVSGSAAAQAAKNATKTIAIVMAPVGDPVAAGLVDSLPRPGGNITGLSALVSEVVAKAIEILKELLPKKTRFAVLWSSRSGITVQEFDATSIGEIDAALAAMARTRINACVVLPNPPNNRNAGLVLSRTRELKLPAIYGFKELVVAGGLLSYGVNYVDLWRRAAVYVDKLLKGANPRDLPIEQASRFELVINLKTAKALGLAIPPALLLRADLVIE